MTIYEQRKYLRRMRNRYWAADRMGRGELLTEMGAVIGLDRKSLILDRCSTELSFACVAGANGTDCR